MNTSNIAQLPAWLRATAQPLTYLAAVMIGMVWLSVGFHLQTELDAAERGAVQNSSNLARTFEEHLIRTVEDADKLILLVRANYELMPETFQLETWAPRQEFINGPTFQLSVINAEGIIVHSSETKRAARIDVSHRDHFRFHAETAEDVISIGKPTIGLASGKPTIHVSRRINAPDGSFGGIVSVSLDPNHFVRFYDSVDLGPQGYIALVGTDGIARAVGGALHLSGHLAGKKILTPAELERYSTVPGGWHFSDGTEIGRVRHLIAHRKVEGLPLIVNVGVSELAIKGRILAKRPSYNLIAGLITVLILLAVGFGIRDRRNLDQARDALRRKSVWFESAVENMTHGLCMFDSNQRIVVSNRRYAEIYDLHPDQIRPGMTLQEVLECRVRNGNYRGMAPVEYIRDRLEAPSEIQKVGDDRSILIKRQRMADGGWVTTHEDITDQKRFDERMAHLAHHDSLTGAANRVLLQKRIDEAFARAERSPERFALHLVDLDHFKQVNDTYGHPVGDQLLSAVTERLQRAIRRSDTLARIGGDEFAIVQTNIEDLAEAEKLAARIEEQMTEPFRFAGIEIRQTLSVGIAHAPHDSDTPEMLLKNADVALYQAKDQGRNRYRVFIRNTAAEHALSIPRDDKTADRKNTRRDAVA